MLVKAKLGQGSYLQISGHINHHLAPRIDVVAE